MALPMYFFYEVGIISAGFFKKKEEPEASEDVSTTRGPSSSAVGGLQTKPAGAGGTAEDDYVSVPDSGAR